MVRVVWMIDSRSMVFVRKNQKNSELSELMILVEGGMRIIRTGGVLFSDIGVV